MIGRKSLSRLIIYIFLSAVVVLGFVFSTNSFGADSSITLTSSSGEDGYISKQNLKGDANNNDVVDAVDYAYINQYIGGVEPALSFINGNAEAFEAADVNGDGIIDANDSALVSSMLSGGMALPNGNFTFGVEDTPCAGYRIKAATISINGGSPIVLTPLAPTNSGYTLGIDSNGIGRVTGPSGYNINVEYTHELTSAIASLSVSSDANGNITEQMLKGDSNRDGKIDGIDAKYMVQYNVADEPGFSIINGNLLAKESADLDKDGIISTTDLANLNDYVNGIKTLPDAIMDFRVVDTPKSGYKIKNVVITANGNVVNLTPDAPISGSYKLVISGGKGTVTGLSLNTNNVEFIHEPIKTTPGTHTVKFDSEGGDYTPEAQTIVDGEKAVEPGNPKREGETFLGWFYKNSNGNWIKWDGTTTTKNITLYSKWSSTGYNIDKSPNTGDALDVGTIEILMMVLFAGITAGVGAGINISKIKKFMKIQKNKE